MGGVIGAIGGKFVIAAAGLLVSASIDGHRLQARVDPSSETSIVSERVADRVDKGGRPHEPGSLLRRGRPMTIALSAGTFPVDALAVARAPLGADIDFVIGRDIFGSHVFDLDFRGRQIRMVLPYEYGNATRRLIPIALTPAAEGSWTFPASIDGKPVSVALHLSARPVDSRLSPPAGAAAPIALALGAATLVVPGVVPAVSPGAEPVIIIGFEAFEDRHVIIDLPHRLLWIDPRVRAPRSAQP